AGEHAHSAARGRWRTLDAQTAPRGPPMSLSVMLPIRAHSAVQSARQAPHPALGQALARVLGGVVDYAALRAAAEGDYATLARELRHLRLAVERAESLLQGTHPAP